MLDAAKWYLDNGKSSIIDSEIDNTVKIINPVYIGKNCNIKNSIIGPYSTIGSNVLLHDSTVARSIVLSGAVIEKETITDVIVDESDFLKVKLVYSTQCYYFKYVKKF